jgi:hypothetical protein
MVRGFTFGDCLDVENILFNGRDDVSSPKLSYLQTCIFKSRLLQSLVDQYPPTTNTNGTRCAVRQR